jgi:hypothetical protein
MARVLRFVEPFVAGSTIGMTRHTHAEDKRSLQDDRADLAADPHEGSPLTEDAGAPLGEDGMPRPEKAAVTHGLLGGAPVAITPEDPRPHDPMTTRDDRPTGD